MSLPPHSLSMIPTSVFFFLLYGMADRDGFLMRMFYFLEWKSTYSKLTDRIHRLGVSRRSSPIGPSVQYCAHVYATHARLCRSEFAGGALLNLVHSNEKVLDDSGEEHMRSESNRALSARAN
jgi:hypothetical protein